MLRPQMEFQNSENSVFFGKKNQKNVFQNLKEVENVILDMLHIHLIQNFKKKSQFY